MTRLDDKIAGVKRPIQTLQQAVASLDKCVCSIAVTVSGCAASAFHHCVISKVFDRDFIFVLVVY
jgi:hypothetical protein